MKKTVSIIGLSVGLAWAASAAQFTLASSSGSVISGNDVASLYDTENGGTAAGLYSTTFGGSASTGYWVDISFDGHPQPVLTDAILKAGPYYIEWGSAALAAFNSGTWTSIILWNNSPGGIKNKPGNAFLGTSHAGLDGTVGTGVVGVPDSGITLALLGMSLVGIHGLRRKLAAA
ncbi:MAG: VPDSG-CTERM sorting domain-containing protein [Verrucomicrobiota bacterium]|jgi:hypothetical protein